MLRTGIREVLFVNVMISLFLSQDGVLGAITDIKVPSLAKKERRSF